MDFQAQLNEYKNELNELQYQQAENPTQDRQDRINWLTNKISEIEFEHGKQERIEAAAQESADVLDNLIIFPAEDDKPAVKLNELCIDDFSFKSVRTAIRNLLISKDAMYIQELSELTTKHRDEIRASAEREANFAFQLREKDKQLRELEQELAAKENQLKAAVEANEEWQKQVNTLTFERDEAFRVRDNAAAEIEGLNAVIKAKTDELNHARAKAVLGELGAQGVDRTEQARREREEWENSRVKIVAGTVRWENDLRKTHYLAELAMDHKDWGKAGDTITFGHLELKKFKEVSAEDAERFRSETAQQSGGSNEEVSVPDLPVAEVVTVPEVQPVTENQFPEVGQVEGLDTSRNQEVAGQTIEERVAALEKAVFGQVKVVA